MSFGKLWSFIAKSAACECSVLSLARNSQSFASVHTALEQPNALGMTGLQISLA